jgi:S1-C subfamily serine protease
MNLRGGAGPILLLILLMPAVACNAGPAISEALKSVSATATEPAIPTATPIPPVASALAGSPTASDSLPLIDAAGLDFAERRIIDVYERISPSVVNINTQVLVRNFYGVVPEEGSGSGFVLDDQGRILTNYHVIENAQQIDVAFSEGTVLPATIVGVDPRNDLAVIRVDAPQGLLKPVEFGTSANLRVGQWAIAIGNPFGQFDRTLTTGVISALNRTLEGSDGRTITGVIQTDAAINRGNSGGPLLDSSGRVIGINTAIFSPSGASAGVGFAVPVDTVRRVLPDLVALGYYRHPWLGVRYGYSITPALAGALGLPVNQGVLLVQLYDNSPLQESGVRGAQQQAVLDGQRIYTGGDILSSVDGQPVSAVDTLETLLEDNYRVGERVRVELLREGVVNTVEVELAEQPR